MTNSETETNTASAFARWLTRHATAVLGAVVALGLLLIFVQLKGDPSHKSVVFLMIGHLGMAFVIAGILGLTIEQFTRVRHDIHRDDLVDALNTNRLETIEDLQRHVLKAVYQRTLPDALIDAAEEAIFKSSFLRRDWQVTYELKKIPAELGLPNSMSLRTTLIYKLQNVTKTQKKLVIPTVIDMSSSHFLADRCGIKGVQVDDHEYSLKEINELVQTTNGNSTCTFEIEKSLGPGEIISVRFEYEQLNPQEASEFLSTRYPGTEVEITAIVPNGDFELGLVSLHQEEPVEVMKSAHHRRWRLGPALFPGQGWALIWKPQPVQMDLASS